MNYKKFWEKQGKRGDLIQMNFCGKLTQEKVNRIVKRIKNKLELKKTDKLLDVGGGAGMLANPLSKYCNATVTDYSKPLLKHLKLKNICCEANKLPFKDETFDKVLCHSVFQYFPSYKYAKEVIKEIVRVTKKSGMIYIMDIPGKEITLLQEIWRFFKGTDRKSKHREYTKPFFYENLAGWDLKIENQIVQNYNLERLSRFNVFIKKTYWEFKYIFGEK